MIERELRLVMSELMDHPVIRMDLQLIGGKHGLRPEDFERPVAGDSDSRSDGCGCGNGLGCVRSRTDEIGEAE